MYYQALWLAKNSVLYNYATNRIWRAYLQNVLSPSTVKIEIYTEMCSYLLQVFSNVFILWQTLLISQLQPYKCFVYWQTELSPSPVYGQTELSPWREPSLWINHSSILYNMRCLGKRVCNWAMWIFFFNWDFGPPFHYLGSFPFSKGQIFFFSKNKVNSPFVHSQIR